jgi:hypothetical protein
VITDTKRGGYGIIRNLPGWEDSRLMRIARLSAPTAAVQEYEVRFGVRAGDSKVKVVTVQFYVGHPHEETTTREEFMAYVKTLSGNLPDYMLHLLLEFSKDTTTNHADLNHIMNRLLEANFDETIATL